METTTLVFLSGARLELPGNVGDNLARKFTAHMKNPQPDTRFASVRYSDGGTNNRSITVDLQSLVCVLHRS